MDIKIITSVPAKPGFASQCMTFMLLMLCLLTASAQEADQACQFSLIDQAFRQYVQTVDRTQIVRIQTLLNKMMPEGSHQIVFDAGALSSGIYFYRIETGNYQDVKKMVLVK